MKTYYLKAVDEQSLYNSLVATGIVNETAHQTVDPQCALDVVGTITIETGRTLNNKDGSTYPETYDLEGFHVNLLAPEGIEGLPEEEEIE